MKILQIVNSAYRCTVEEQDDPVIWITHAMKGAGAELDILLRGNTVNYAVANQTVAEFSIGGVTQTQPPNLTRDLTSLKEKSVKIYFVEDDCHERGLKTEDLLEGIQAVKRDELPNLFDQYDQIWNW